jgi:hypothetical protein
LNQEYNVLKRRERIEEEKSFVEDLWVGGKHNVLEHIITVILIKSKLRERDGSSLTVARMDLRTGESLKSFYGYEYSRT